MIWFPILLIAFAAACYFVAARYLSNRSAWTGQAKTTASGSRYYWRVAKRKNAVVGSWLGIPGRFSIDFHIEPETWFHRFSKTWGFCTEFETGDIEFDRRCFVRSDENVFQQKLRSDPDLHALILKLFDFGAQSIYSTPSILTIKMKSPSEWVSDASADLLIEKLTAVRERLSAIALSPSEPDVTVRTWETVFIALPFFMAVTAAATGAMLIGFGYKIVEKSLILPLTAKWGVAFIFIFLIMIRLAFRRSSYGHLILKTFVQFGIASTFLACLLGLLFLNCEYDVSQPRVYFQPVAGKYIVHGSKGSVDYMVSVQDWHSPGGHPVRFSVGRRLYESVDSRSRVKIVDRPGLFGVEWVGPIEAIPLSFQ